jgi:hypothetical protein
MFEKYIKLFNLNLCCMQRGTEPHQVKLVISFCEGIVVFPITAGQTVLVLTMSLCSKHAQALAHTCVHCSCTFMQCLNGL